MQECDILFGMLKTLIHENIQTLMTGRIAIDRPARLSKDDLGVILNGRQITMFLIGIKISLP